MLLRQKILLSGAILFLFLAIWLILNRTATDMAVESNVTGVQKNPDISFNFHVKPILSDKCFACHGPDANKRKAGLRLDVEESAKTELKESPGKFAIIPGDISGSQLITRIFTENENELMPPPDSHLQLSESEKEILKSWIENGAEYDVHWSFIPPVKVPLSDVKNESWPKNEIDYFILAEIEKADLKPSEETSPSQLLRRLSLDLTGLPPSIEEVNRFEKMISNDFEAVVDYYLAKPAYGEKMTRDWLDVARYADSHGYQDDSYRTMWPWRDWVIHAFNQNLPYDQFLTWQIAGDLLPNATLEQILATGFNRNHPITQEGGVIDEEYRSTYVSDRTNTLGKGVLGLTLECAKCHDHKYDQLSQKDYFRFYAFFNYVNEKGLQMDAVQAKNRKYYADAPYITVSKKEVRDILSFINYTDTVPVNVMVMNDSAYKETFVLGRGEYDAPGEAVDPGTPKVILPYPENFPANRLGLAMWLTDKNNPLTARVYVNRLWSLIFGNGIVRTVEDFGNQGALPSHPELLDWLAVEFMENKWDVQHILKKMVMSATYRQSSAITPDKKKIDPENILLSRGPRYRLSAEEIRDYVLASSGLLNAEIGGPSVKPYQPPGLWEETNAGGNRGILTNYIPDTGDKLYRRSIYTFWKRTLPPPSMALFDAPNRDLCEVRRQKTNTPLQALALQNDEQILEAARVLAENLSNQSITGKEAINEVFRRILIRNPAPGEKESLYNFYKENLQKFSDEKENAVALLNVGQYPSEVQAPPEAAAIMMVAQVLYNLDETINRE